MKTIDAKHYVLQVSLDRDKVSSFSEYPYCLPVCRNMTEITMHPAVTFLVGENGAGKSTLLEAIAIASGFNAEGGSRNFGFSTRASHSCLHEVLTIRRGLKLPQDGFFLRAESFYNVATEVDSLQVTGYGDRSLHDQSHGESIMTIAMERFRGNGIYLLDEPEAALSPTRQLSLLARIHQLVNSASQFIVATHSPILMAYPNASIYSLDNDSIKKINYTDSEHFAVTKQFLNNPEAMLSELLKE